jgi:uncharacterized glyoxalase superfamily protein PhnB
VVERFEPLLAFFSDVLGGEERGERELRTDGTIGHTEFGFGDSMLMLSEANENPPRPSVVYAYVEDVDTVFRRAAGHRSDATARAEGLAVGRPGGRFPRPVRQPLVDRDVPGWFYAPKPGLG